MKMMIWVSMIMAISALTFRGERQISGVVSSVGDGRPLPGVQVSVVGAKLSTVTDAQGKYKITVPSSAKKLVFSYVGFLSLEVEIGTNLILNVKLDEDAVTLNELVVVGYGTQRKAAFLGGMNNFAIDASKFNTENYNPINENGFQLTSQSPLTTFSADVDRAAYSNIRRFISKGELPPVDAVRIEEMINYFDYQFPQPADGPLSVSTEVTDSPWNKGLKLVHIGVQARTIPNHQIPPSHLVFLIDVSGSMFQENKLPLLKRAFKLLVDQLRPEDKVSIVVYAGAVGTVLTATPGDQKMKILEALESLEAGGSTAGEKGIMQAYKLAEEHFVKDGNNRVILATDGDFNVGVSSEGGLERLIEEKRKSGVFLSVIGVGTGNFKDSHVETLADKGNGNYAYIDNIQEARKVFINEFGGTLFTVASDVKLQVEFNPAFVSAYRLVGYENRMLKNEDFNDDKKDAGEVGSGHTVTAIYEIIPAGVKSDYHPQVDPLKYSKREGGGKGSKEEMLTLKIRYKDPGAAKSKLMEVPVKSGSTPMTECSENFRFAAAVAEFGLLLRNSEYKGAASFDHVVSGARAAMGKDEEGYRAEFIQLVKMAEVMRNGSKVAEKH